MQVLIFLFDHFETLDVFGPVEVLGEIEEFNLHYCSLSGGVIKSRHQVSVITEVLELPTEKFILFIPGGLGTRTLVNSESGKSTLEKLQQIAQKADYCLTVCTGSAVLAKTGLLDHKLATSNKIAWPWVISVSQHVKWKYNARWCVDGRFYTSSGVSAGIDMTLGFIADRYGMDKAKSIADHMEYLWNPHPGDDPFAQEGTFLHP